MLLKTERTESGIRRLLRLVIVGSFFGAFLMGQSSAGLPDLRSYLPADNEAREWKKDGAPQEFKGEDLYHISTAGRRSTGSTDLLRS